MNNHDFWRSWALRGQLFVSTWQHLRQCHPAETWAIHLKRCWVEVQNTYYMIQTICNLRNMKLILSIIWMTPSKVHFYNSSPFVVCYLEAPENTRSSGTWLVHPSSSTPLIEVVFFFEKIGNMFLHHLVALSSCNTSFQGEKWQLWQLEYSGKMQLLQKHFDMEKTYVDALWTNKTYTEYRKTYQSSMLNQDVPSLRIFNHKISMSYI